MTLNLNGYVHKRGIEREGLRILKNGAIALSPHPKSLGSKLTHSNITVDFAESLLELITEPFDSIDKTLNRLQSISAFCTQNLPEDELLLSTSMPLIMTENKIHIANFGTSNSGKMKEVYRRGLAKRYGKIMQTISGVHYNFSYDLDLLTELSAQRKLSHDQLYFSAINHYFDFMWLLPYLFGSSPICAKTSVKNKPNYLQELNKDFYIGEYTTSLRMSNLGYQSNAQKNLFISYNNLKDYVYDLIGATKQTYPDFEKIGLYDQNHLRQQLNTSILQIENEYYNAIRPKQIVKRCERPACALLNRGVRYLEVRVLDVNPFNSLGIDKPTAHFIEALLLTCLMQPTKHYAQSEIVRNKYNFNQVVEKGRYPNLTLTDTHNNTTLLKEMGIRQLELIAKIAQQMGNDYEQAVATQLGKIEDSNKTPSAQVMKFRETDYLGTILDLSQTHTQNLKSIQLNEIEKKAFHDQAQDSIQKQLELEQADCCDLDTYIDHYYRSADCTTTPN
ncbi:glutamate--cysteine ligase [Fastidiosibacter lacustris]|uniref:glutamate--cysteine ligase n=1 Tax=Fastidiosibacter lacustris TaxID=2056695 RepID=UPI001EFEE747|nr:glutamate--cysteine ligase [Fastidiosibacter lacustris]